MPHKYVQYYIEKSLHFSKENSTRVSYFTLFPLHIFPLKHTVFLPANSFPRCTQRLGLKTGAGNSSTFHRWVSATESLEPLMLPCIARKLKSGTRAGN